MLPEPFASGSLDAYLVDLFSNALAGDVFAVSLLLLSFYLLVFLVHKMTAVLFLFLRKIILFIIVSLAFYQFLLFLQDKVAEEGLSQGNIVIGLLGALAGLLAFLLAFNAAFSSIKTVRKERKEEKEEPKPLEEKEDARKALSVEAFKGDKSIGAALAYLIVAEFGVISSKTIAAPNPEVGLFFFAAFMVAAFFFIRQSYKSYATGLRHLLAVFVVGFILSMILGYFWSGYSIEELLSLSYFATDSLVAFVTGIAVSLFMGSKA